MDIIIKGVFRNLLRDLGTRKFEVEKIEKLNHCSSQFFFFFLNGADEKIMIFFF